MDMLIPPISLSKLIQALDIRPLPFEAKPEPNINRKEFCYRLENADGWGVYQCSEGHSHPMDCERMHPPPTEDAKLRPAWTNLRKYPFGTKPYHFGFSSMEQLRRWFYCEDWCHRARDAGIRIVIYQTEDYYYGDTQMIFNKETSTLIGTADLI